MLQLLLSDAEARELRAALATRLRELREELVHTEQRAMREELRALIEQLERIEGRLEELGPTAAA